MNVARTLPLQLAQTDLAVLTSRHHTSELTARGTYGLTAGYTSLDTAINHLSQLTRGDARHGAAVLQVGERFFGVRVLEKIGDARTSSGLRGSWLDIEDDSKLRLMPFDQNPNLRAVVDGATVLLSKFAG